VLHLTATVDGAEVGPLGLPSVPLGDSDQVQLGDPVRILGYPGIGGDTITFTAGSVAGFAGEDGVGDRAWIKTDATVAGGNSGGTALDADGRLVGVPTRGGTGDSGAVADCRVVQDTNGDGRLDEADTCIPIGGFINSLRPVNLARPLLEEASRREAVDAATLRAPDLGGEPIHISGPRFAPGPTPPDPVGAPVLLPSGIARLCGFFDYQSMDPESSLTVEWYRDARLVDTETQAWGGPASGTDHAVCLGDEHSPIGAGVWEIALYVDDVLEDTGIVHVGHGYWPIIAQLRNDTGTELCGLGLSPSAALTWGTNRLFEPLAPGAVVELALVRDRWSLAAIDCDGDVVSEIHNLWLTGAGTVPIR
jgi:hypothetical protein